MQQKMPDLVSDREALPIFMVQGINADYRLASFAKEDARKLPLAPERLKPELDTQLTGDPLDRNRRGLHPVFREHIGREFLDLSFTQRHDALLFSMISAIHFRSG